MTTRPSEKPSSPSSLDPGQLRTRERHRLAAILERFSSCPLQEYSAQLWGVEPQREMDPLLFEILEPQLRGLGLTHAMAQAAVEELRRHRVLQTSTHLCLSEGPTFLAVHLAATCGQPAGRPYLVAAYSGVPFSNPAWSGSLNLSHRHSLAQVLRQDSSTFRLQQKSEEDRARDGGTLDERRIALIPATQRDAMVCWARVGAKPGKVYRDLLPPLADLIGSIGEGEAFSPWALRASARALKIILHRDDVVFFDLNALMTDYLERVFRCSEHGLTRLFFQEESRQALLAAFGQETPWFVTARFSGKRHRMDPARLEGGLLVAREFEMDWTPDAVAEALADRRLCPGLLPCFAALAFYNGVFCLGSFEQVEYLDRMKAALSDMGWPDGRVAEQRVDGLTSGRCVDDRDGLPVWPLDLILGHDWTAPLHGTLGQWMAPLRDRLLGGSRIKEGR